MRNFVRALVLLFLFLPVGCAYVDIQSRPLLPEEVQLLVKVVTTQALVDKYSAEELQRLESWANGAYNILEGTETGNFQPFLDGFSDMVPVEYRDVLELVLVLAKKRINFKVMIEEGRTSLAKEYLKAVIAGIAGGAHSARLRAS